MRCLALAEAWRRTQDPVIFASTEDAPTVRERGFRTLTTAAKAGSAADARETAELAREHAAEWVVVDGYQFDTEYQKALKTAGTRLLVIDDHGHAGSYPADLVLDQNLNAQPASYASRAAETRLLLGVRYALLREDFARWRGWRRPIPDRAQKLLVTYGGADPANATAKVLDALTGFSDLEVVAVIGPHNGNPLPELPQVRYERGVTDLSELMATCDLAITAAGSTCWELAFLQTPMLVMPIADNQRPVAAALAEQGAAVNLGWHADVSTEQIAAAAADLITDEPRRRAMASAGRALIDGEGAARVVANMKKALISLRPATNDDCRRVWEWSNEAAVRAASFRDEPIPWEKHQQWFAARLSDPATKFYIAEKDAPIGQTRFALGDEGEATISTSLDATQRGRGLGSAVILAACERLFAETRVSRVRAFIKPHNDASLQAFARAGFDRVQDARIEGEAAAQFILEREAA
jgi:UDP-2,4-diacetamido-2,4,6-trideoxy-beta-L-altropyranose hydrolase